MHTGTIQQQSLICQAACRAWPSADRSTCSAPGCPPLSPCDTARCARRRLLFLNGVLPTLQPTRRSVAKSGIVAPRCWITFSLRIQRDAAPSTTVYRRCHSPVFSSQRRDSFGTPTDSTTFCATPPILWGSGSDHVSGRFPSAMRTPGLEPGWVAPPAPKAGASTNFATSAYCSRNITRHPGPVDWALSCSANAVSRRMVSAISPAFVAG